mgnify:FL=1
MKTSVYIAATIITLSVLSAAGFLMLKSSKPLPSTVQAEQNIQINWGEGVDVHGSAEPRQPNTNTQVAQN